MVKTWAQTLELVADPQKIAEYREYHARVWPEVLRALQAVGVLQMKIYLLGTRLFMYMETVDDFEPTRDFARHMEIEPKCVEWGEKMRTYQCRVPEAKEGEWWAYMEEVFDLAAQHEAAFGKKITPPK